MPPEGITRHGRRAPTAFTPSTTHGGHPRSRGAPGGNDKVDLLVRRRLAASPYNVLAGPLFVAPASLHHRWDALDDDWVQRLGRRRAWEEPVRAALLLKIGDLLVGQLDVMLALPRQQLVRLGMPVDDNVRLHFRRIEERHPGVGQCCAARLAISYLPTAT